MDTKTEVSSPTNTAPARKSRWEWLTNMKAKVGEKLTKLKPNPNVKQKLAQAGAVVAMSFDDVGGYAIKTDKIPKEFVPASINTEFLPPDSPDPEAHAKKPVVTTSGKAPEPQNLTQMVKDGKPFAEVKGGVISRPSSKAA